MTTSNWDGREWDCPHDPKIEIPLPDGFLQDVHDAIDDRLERDSDYARFVENAANVHGPIGELLRDIINQYADFRRQEDEGNTTMGEFHRWDPVIESAMGVVSWLGGTDLS